MPVVQAGQPAPDFTLARFEADPLTRAGLEGKITVLVFYPFAFSPVCTDQLSVYNEVLDDFAERGATLYGVSCDAVWSQRALVLIGPDAVVQWSHEADSPGDLPGANLIFDALDPASV